MIRRSLAILGLVALLGACASGVNLNEVPVSDATGKKVDPAPATPPVVEAPKPDSNLNSRDVKTITVDEKAASGAGPGGTARIIYFDYDSFAVRPEFQSVLEAHARYLNADRKRHVFIEGHTDERGGREYNIALGQKRAEAVRRVLGLLGVADSQVEAVSFGKEKLADSSGTEDGFAKNRRAEISYR